MCWQLREPLVLHRAVETITVHLIQALEKKFLFLFNHGALWSFLVCVSCKGEKLWSVWTHKVHPPGGPGHHVVRLCLGSRERSEHQVLQAEGSRREGRVWPAHREEEEDLRCTRRGYEQAHGAAVKTLRDWAAAWWSVFLDCDVEGNQQMDCWLHEIYRRCSWWDFSCKTIKKRFLCHWTMAYVIL